VQTYPTLDLDTFLTTVYCVVDDLYREQCAPRKPARPGPRPDLADSEVLTLALLAQWQPRRSERAFLAHAVAHWRAYFPRLLSQSAFNRRARDLQGALAALGPALSRQATAALGLPPAAYEVLDGVPVPLLRRCRGRRHRLFGPEAAVGRGGSDREWYYGLKLLAAVDARGFLSGGVAGPANTEERWLAEALFRWRQDPAAPPPTAEALATALGLAHRRRGRRQGPSGPLGPRLGAGAPHAGVSLGDLGFRGAAWGRHWRAAYGAVVLTRAAYAPLAAAARRAAGRWLSGLRQRVETAFQGLTDRFGLRFPRARSYWGLLTRLSAKVAAFNVAVYVNHLFGRPAYAFFDPLG
jgi:hypothetical protein